MIDPQFDPQLDDALDAALERRVARRVGDQIEECTVAEAIMIRMTERAMAGDGAALRELCRIGAQRAKAAADEQDEAIPPVTVQFFTHDPPSEALKLLGVLRQDDDGPMVVERWVYEAALARDPGLWERLGESERETLEQVVGGRREENES